MVKGHRLDKKAIFNALNEASLIVAHYATFDRACLEAQWKDVPLKPWACSMAEVPWRQEGIESAKLEYLAYRYRFFYESHRATADCLAGLHLLAQPLPLSKKPVLKALLEQSQQPTFRLWALDAPIKHKDILKNRRYRWNPEGRHKAWSIDFNSNQVLEELKFLWKTIYDYQAPIPVEVIYATDRYSKMANLDQHWIENLEQIKGLIEC